MSPNPQGEYSMNKFLRGMSAIAVAAGISVLVACSGENDSPDVVSVDGSSPSSEVNREQQLGEYRDCLTENGVTLLEEPTEEGLPQVDKERTPLDTVSSATEACRAQLPSGGEVTQPDPDEIATRQRYAECMRENGIPAYPDPDPRTGDPRISEELDRQLKNDPKLPAAQEACQAELGGSPAGEGVFEE
jgi:hypothetical protein